MEETKAQNISKVKNKKPNRKVLHFIIGGGILLAVVIGAIFVTKNMLSNDRKSVISVYDEVNDVTAIYVNEKRIAIVEGNITWLQRNMSDSVYYFQGEKQSIYSIEGKKIDKLGEDLELIYVARNANRALVMDEDGVLYIYNGKNLEKITDKPIDFATLSGDGKTYSYFSEGNSYFGKKPGKEKKVDDLLIAYISDDGKCKYAVTPGEDEEYLVNIHKEYFFMPIETIDLYYVDEAGKSDLLKEDVYIINGLNAEGTEIMFGTETETYISVKGEKPKKVSDNAVYYVYGKENHKVQYDQFLTVDSLEEVIYITADNEAMNNKCCMFGEGYEEIVIVDQCEIIWDIDEEFTKFIYLNADYELCKAEIKKDSKKHVIATDVIEAQMSDDGEHIYYATMSEEINELHYVDSNMKDTKIDDVEFYWSLNVVGNNCCYVETDESFFVIDKKEITEIEQEGALFYDYSTEKAYWKDDNKVYALEGEKMKALKGQYEYISDYQTLY